MTSPYKKTYAEVVTSQQTRRSTACRKAEAATSTLKARNSPSTSRNLSCSQNQDQGLLFDDLSLGTNHSQINAIPLTKATTLPKAHNQQSNQQLTKDAIFEFQIGIQLGEILTYARHQSLSQGNQAQIQQNLAQNLRGLEKMVWKVVDTQNQIIDAQNSIIMDLSILKAIVFRIQPDHGGPFEGLSSGLYAQQMAAPPGFENHQ